MPINNSGRGTFFNIMASGNTFRNKHNGKRGSARSTTKAHDYEEDGDVIKNVIFIVVSRTF